MTEQNHGKIKIKIADVMKERQISKTKLSYLAFLQLRQLNNLINEKAARVDFDVLARICHALDCRIEDILEYVPADPEEDNSNLEKRKNVCYNRQQINDRMCSSVTRKKPRSSHLRGFFYPFWQGGSNPRLATWCYLSNHLQI